MTETHKNNGALLLRDHLFRSPTWDCGETVVLLALSEYHPLEWSEYHDNMVTERGTGYIRSFGNKNLILGWLLICFFFNETASCSTARLIAKWWSYNHKVPSITLDPVNVKQLLGLSHNSHLRKWRLLVFQAVLTIREWCCMGTWVLSPEGW